MDRFIMTNSICGWQVSDADTGHPVTEPEDAFVAQEQLKKLNNAARKGSQSLARALGCVND